MFKASYRLNLFGGKEAMKERRGGDRPDFDAAAPGMGPRPEGSGRRGGSGSRPPRGGGFGGPMMID